MKLAILALLVLIPAASAGRMPYIQWKWPYFQLWWSSHYGNSLGTQCDCTSKRIPLEDKIALIARNNDHNGDGVTDGGDIYYDVHQRYDKNKDNNWTESECIEGFKCMYGDTEYVAQYVCAELLNGEAVLPNYDAVFKSPSFGMNMPREQFVQMNRERYGTFFYKRCVNRELTVEEKLAQIVDDNDFNKDGVVTSQDIAYDLTNRYDADKNGETSKTEWVAHWVCRYGDSGDYARYKWELLLGQAQSVPNNYFSGPPFNTGVPIADFKANNRQNYENYRTKDASSYIQPNN